jgi:hypothetical protein
MADDIIGMHEVLDALEAVIRSSDPDKRAALAKVMDGGCGIPHWTESGHSPDPIGRG